MRRWIFRPSGGEHPQSYILTIGSKRSIGCRIGCAASSVTNILVVTAFSLIISVEWVCLSTLEWIPPQMEYRIIVSTRYFEIIEYRTRYRISFVLSSYVSFRYPTLVCSPEPLGPPGLATLVTKHRSDTNTKSNALVNQIKCFCKYYELWTLLTCCCALQPPAPPPQQCLPCTRADARLLAIPMLLLAISMLFLAIPKIFLLLPLGPIATHPISVTSNRFR